MKLLQKAKSAYYQRFVERDPKVQASYQGYVEDSPEFHRKHRFQSWLYLASLNWYAKKPEKRTPPIPPSDKERFGRGKLVFPESSALSRPSPEELAARLCQADIVSFDVFDTLILRPFSSPKDLFAVLGQEMGISSFPRLRVEAEREARRQREGGEVRLSDIYRCLQHSCGLDPVQWMRREEELERAFCFANPYFVRVYSLLKEKKKKLIAVSDMYLSKETVQALLDHCGFCGFQEIFVSCEHGKGKWDGRLQAAVSEKLGRGVSIVHVGDNAQSDVSASQACGWQAVHYPSVGSVGNAYRMTPSGSLVESVYRGLVHAKLHSGLSVLNPHYEHGYVVGGLLACGYCEWLNRLAKQKGIERFWFAARDGEILQKVYNLYYRKIPNDYVAVSRFSLYQAGFAQFSAEFCRDILQSRIAVNGQPKRVSMVLRESGLDFLEKNLAEVQLEPESLFTRREYEKLLSLIQQRKPEIVDRFAENRAAAIQYFQTRIGEAGTICLVDVGWNGTIYRILRSLFSEGNPNILGALLGTTKTREVALDVSVGRLSAYLFSPSQNLDLLHHHKPELHNLLLEFLFTSCAPTLLQYCLGGDGQTKLIFGVDPPATNKEATRLIQQGMLDFARDYHNVTSGYKNWPEISAYDAFAPFQQRMNHYAYAVQLFGDCREETLAGNLVSGKGKTFGEFMKEKNYI